MPRRPHRPDTNDDAIINVIPTSAARIHKTSAASRANAYDKLADAVRDGSVTTVNEAVALYNPFAEEISKVYTEDINALRKSRLHDADDKLPSDAEQVFRLFAKEYREAAK